MIHRHRKNPKEAAPEETNPEAAPETETAAASDRENDGNLADPEVLRARIATLEAQLKDEQLRAAAREQNLHRRHREELQAAHKFAAARFASEMLPVKDYLEMALLDQSGNFEALKTGVDMTLKQLISAFEAAHVSEINPKPGDPLDPNLHQAMSAEVADAPVNTVLRVMQKGYALNERVLRPAMVAVAKAAEQNPPNA